MKSLVSLSRVSQKVDVSAWLTEPVQNFPASSRIRDRRKRLVRVGEEFLDRAGFVEEGASTKVRSETRRLSD